MKGTIQVLSRDVSPAHSREKRQRIGANLSPAQGHGHLPAMLVAMPRLFFALQPHPAQRRTMHEAAAPLLRELGGRAVLADDLHLTLCFIGEVEGAPLDALLTAAGRIAAPVIDLRLHRLDYWPDSRVLCLLPESRAGVETVVALAARLSAAVRAAGFAADSTRFRPHITVGRLMPSPATPARTWPQPLADSLPLTAEAFVLMGSKATTTGPRYAVHHSWRASVQAGHPHADS